MSWLVLLGFACVDERSAEDASPTAASRAALLALPPVSYLSDAPWLGEGGQPQCAYGAAIASAGDVNADGFDDVIVGAQLLDAGNGDEGRAFLYLGGAGGLGLVPAWTGEANSSGAYFGSAVSEAGDVNGDGYGDVIVGAFGFSNGVFQQGKAYLYLGTSSGLTAGHVWSVESGHKNGQLGAAVGSLGDVNADGFDDVFVQQFLDASFFQGSVDLYHGSATGLPLTPSASIVVDGMVYAFGVGDLNADGYADLAVSGAVSPASPEVFVHLGSAAGLDPVPAQTLVGEQDDSLFGIAAPAGDVDGDGFDDLLVSAAWYDATGTDDGRLTLYRGSPSGVETTPAWTHDGEDGEWLGLGRASAGDVNADGYDDIVVAGIRADGAVIDGGRVYLFAGSPSGLADSPGWQHDGDQAANYGGAVASAGDVDGDGYADVLVAAEAYNGAIVEAGRVYLYRGRCHDDGPDADGDSVGDGCDTCPGVDDRIDLDLDSVADACDVCPAVHDPLQVDTDGDGTGDLCDACPIAGPPDDGDTDLDGVCDVLDCGPLDATVYPGAPELCDGQDNACAGAVPADEGDLDGDGSWACADCDDADPTAFPGAPELCDGVDNGCVGAVSIEEIDLDGDGVTTCAGDCDPALAEVYPGAPELCDGRDNACAGALPIDEFDLDGDGFLACAECDDTDATTFPAAPQLCDGVDNTCVGVVPADEADGDGDGFRVCDLDCDDTDSSAYPGAPELCDGRNNGCTGAVPTNELDGDEDGFVACLECDDADPAVFPGAAEVCDGRDTSCAGALSADEADLDGDGVSACAGDCLDDDPTRFPGEAERCDDRDDDCDGEVDEQCSPPPGCGCASPPLPPAVGWGVALAVVLLRRRRVALTGP